MKESEKNFLKSLCKYCISKYTISNSGPLISSLIYQLCKYVDIDVPVIQGVLRVHINDNYSRSFAHCFNVYKGIVLDASIYQFALTNRAIGHLFPVYVFGNVPAHIDYIMERILTVDFQTKFSKNFWKMYLEMLKTIILNL